MFNNNSSNDDNPTKKTEEMMVDNGSDNGERGSEDDEDRDNDGSFGSGLTKPFGCMSSWIDNGFIQKAPTIKFENLVIEEILRYL